MLVSRFSCPECGVVLRPANPVAEGKRIKCPKCAGIFTVTASKSSDEDEEEERTSSRAKSASGRSRSAPVREDDEDDFEPRPKRKKLSSREEDEDDDQDAPRLRKKLSSRDQDDDGDYDDEDEAPRPRKKRKPARKRSRSNSGALQLILIITGSIIALAAVGLAVYFFVVPLFENEYQKQARLLNQGADILAKVTDQASAEGAKPKLVSLGETLKQQELKARAEMEKGLKKLKDDPEAIKKAIDKAMADPEGARAEAEKMQKKMQPLIDAQERLGKEMLRVTKVPGGKDLLKAFFEAWGQPSQFVDMLDMMKENPFQSSGPGGIRFRGGF